MEGALAEWPHHRLRRLHRPFSSSVFVVGLLQDYHKVVAILCHNAWPCFFALDQSVLTPMVNTACCVIT